MTEGEFPFRSFTMRSEGYDRHEVDSYVDELRGEIIELRRALETSTATYEGAEGDVRLHDPEGAVARTLAIAQETADRVLHDAQVEADRHRGEADQHAKTVVAEADDRAARLLGEMEAQAAEVREQGVAAARSAIQVERDTAMAELARVRRVRDDLRTEAVDLKSALDRYRGQALEASDMLAAASAGPLVSLDLPDFIDDDVVLAGIPTAADHAEEVTESAIDGEIVFASDSFSSDDATSDDVASDSVASDLDLDDDLDDIDEGEQFADVIAFEPASSKPELVAVDDVDDTDADDTEEASAEEISAGLESVDESDTDDTDDTANAGSFVDALADEASDTEAAGKASEAEDVPSMSESGSGAFLAEVLAAAEDDDVALAPENDDSDRFLSELRGITADSDLDLDLDSEAADTFFDN